MSTSLSATILEFLNNIFGSEEARAEFIADPEGYLAQNNLDDLSCADFDDALVSFFENAEFSNSTEFDNDGGDTNVGGVFSNTVAAPGQSDTEAIAENLTRIVNEYGDTYITNNDNDIVNDASFNGTIISDGDVSFDNDITSASGDGAVAAGGDIDGDVVTGDGNVIGDDNQVGDGAFGDGSIQGGVTVDDGGAFANNGSSATANTDNSSDDDVTTNLTDVGNDKSIDTDTDIDTTTTTETNTDNSVDLDDSLNDNRDQSSDFDDSFNPSNDGDDDNVASGNRIASDDA